MRSFTTKIGDVDTAIAHGSSKRTSTSAFNAEAAARAWTKLVAVYTTEL
jgi:hypothetical protein